MEVNYAKIYDSIKSMFELTTRIDERIKAITKNHDELENKIDDLIESTHDMNSRIKMIERYHDEIFNEIKQLGRSDHDIQMKIASIEITHGGSENRWKAIINFVVQIAWVILAAFLLTKLGLQAPAVP